MDLLVWSGFDNELRCPAIRRHTHDAGGLTEHNRPVPAPACAERNIGSSNRDRRTTRSWDAHQLAVSERPVANPLTIRRKKWRIRIGIGPDNGKRSQLVRSPNIQLLIR